MVKTLKVEMCKVSKDDLGRKTHDVIGRMSAGQKVEVTFDREKNMMIVEGTNDMTLGCSYGHALSINCRPDRYPKYFGGKAPSEKTLMKWEEEGYCKTVTGLKVEPDGFGYDGSPSWLIVFGLI